MFTVVRHTEAAFAMARAILWTGAADGRIMLAHRLGWGIRIVPIEYRHIVLKVYSQFYQPSYRTVPVKPRGLMNELALAVTDNLIRICRAGLDHAPDHLPGFLSVAVIQVVPHYITVTLDCASILV